MLTIEQEQSATQTLNGGVTISDETVKKLLLNIHRSQKRLQSLFQDGIRSVHFDTSIKESNRRSRHLQQFFWQTLCACNANDKEARDRLDNFRIALGIDSEPFGEWIDQMTLMEDLVAQHPDATFGTGFVYHNHLCIVPEVLIKGKELCPQINW